MKKAKNIGQKNIKTGVIRYANEDTNEIKKFLIILVGVAVIALLLYFVTAKYLVKDNFQTNNTPASEDIAYTTVKGGTLFNRPYGKYYVLCYDKSDEFSPYYSALTSLYKGETKLYTMDLSLEVNKQFVKDAGNDKATKPSELSIINPTLILIKNGKIDEYYEGKDAITNILK